MPRKASTGEALPARRDYYFNGLLGSNIIDEDNRAGSRYRQQPRLH